MKKKKRGVIQKAAQILLDGLENRFPITNIMIASALLDPGIQHIEAVSNWLFDTGKTRFEVLRDAMIELKIDSIDDHVYQQQHPTKNSADNIRIQLLKKYSISTNSGDVGIEHEISNFQSLRDDVADVLEFWRNNEKNYPNLGKLAKVLLSKPASSAKSESAFSVAGVLLSKKRSHIDPLRAQKVLFIHDNYKLCKSVVS